MKLRCACLFDGMSEASFRARMEEVSKKRDSVAALTFQPHFSLRGDFEVDKKSVNEMVADLAEVVKSFRKMHLSLSRYGFYKWKVFYFEIAKSKEVQELHEEILKSIQKFRSEWVPEELLAGGYKGKQAEYIKTYGYQFAMDYFSPHVTLAGPDLEDEAFEKLKEEFVNRQENVAVVVDRVVLFDRDNDNKIFKTFEFGN